MPIVQLIVRLVDWIGKTVIRRRKRVSDLEKKLERLPDAEA